MKLRKPGHTTVVAYLALFVALGGTALAARDQFGANELKPLVVREQVRKVPASAGQDVWSAIARCRQHEQFVSGGGGWITSSSPLPAQPSVRYAAVTRNKPNGPAIGYEVQGFNPQGLENELVAQALCLPK